MSRQRQQGCQPLHLQVRAVEAGACPPGQCITTRTVSVSAHACWQAPGGFDNKSTAQVRRLAPWSQTSARAVAHPCGFHCWRQRQ